VSTVADAAAQVLNDNWRGTHTVPASGLYPHQWSWDSAFIAIGLRHLSPVRAQTELDSLFAAQWTDGRLPQIVFDVRHDDSYSPGDAFWRSASIPGSASVPTSGLIQPPNHAMAAWLVHESDPDESTRRGFLERAYPRLSRWHDYLARRRGGDSGLAYVVHPWESGMDNSPYWDAALGAMTGDTAASVPRPDLRHAAAAHRPSNAEYGKYLSLAARYRENGCDDSPASSPFRFEDPAVNALWARSELALAQIAESVGADPRPHLDRAARITRALEQLWSDDLGVYTARDLATGVLQPYRSVAGLIPVLVPGIGRGDELRSELAGPHFRLGEVALVPSLDLDSAAFDRSRYWRGPSWFNTAWLLAQALLERGEPDAARALALDCARSALAGDFPEYLDPYTREPRGTLRFSWTAALTLDLVTRLKPDLPDQPSSTRRPAP